LKMAKKKNRKRSRSSRDDHASPPVALSPSTPCSSSTSGKCDLFIAMPSRSSQSTATLPVALLIKQLLDRLEATGFSHVALTHIVYGTPRVDQGDCAETAIPSALWKQEQPQNSNATAPQTRRRKIQVLRRLHAIVENAADVGFYAARKEQDVVLQDYDLISLAPRNEAAFLAACTSATACEIITLDYSNSNSSSRSGSGNGLPFRIRAPAIKAAMERMVRFEVLYAPAILHANQRRFIIQASREFLMASRSLSRREKERSIIFSSGDRRRLLKVEIGSKRGGSSASNSNNADVGALALRTYGDLRNLFETVLGFDDHVVASALSTAGLGAIQQGHVRRFGGGISNYNAMASTAIANVAVENGDCRLLEFQKKSKTTAKSVATTKPPPASSIAKPAASGPAFSGEKQEPRRGPASVNTGKRKASPEDRDIEMDDEEEEKIQDGFISF
jgi:RNase P subunit p30